jgi:hypothetical protein
MKITFLAIALLLMGLPVFAQTLSAQKRTEDVKTLDEFFNDREHLSLSGCSESTWDLIHQAVRVSIQGQELPPSSVDGDLARSEQTDKCFHIAYDAKIDLMKSLNKFNRANKNEIISLGDYTHPDINAVPLVISNIDSNNTKISLFFDWFATLQSVIDFAKQSSEMYFNHAEQTRYRNLVERYNALANSLANVHLAQGSSYPIQPRALHCESSMNSATGVTRLDCQ